MGYRDQLEAARGRIEALELELGRLRAGAVQWTPEEVVQLRQVLHDAQLAVARLQRERDALEAELREAKQDLGRAEREREARMVMDGKLGMAAEEARERNLLRHRADELERALEAERARQAALLAQIEGRVPRASEPPPGPAHLVAARMWGRTWEARARHLANQLATARQQPAGALTESDLAAFRVLFSPEALRAAGPERGRELFLRIASSIYDGHPFRREAIEPSLTLLRAAGHTLRDEGDGFRGAALELIARPDHLELRIGEHLFALDAGTG